MGQNGSSALLIVLPLMFVLMIVAVGAGALMGGGASADVGSVIAFGQRPVAQAPPTMSFERLGAVAGQEGAASLASFRSVGLGFTVDYPFGWRKKETPLGIVFSPSADGLEPALLKDVSFWIGTPADNRSEPAEVLQHVVAGFPPSTQIVGQGSLYMGEQNWVSAEIVFESITGERSGRAIVAATSKNEVGYFLVAAAPAGQWEPFQPLLQAMIDSFNFVAEAIIPPTPTGPAPPTPTATPTPIVYIVQSGDTLSHISVKYGVSIEALATRNGIDRPESLRVGQKLVIPVRRGRP